MGALRKRVRSTSRLAFRELQAELQPGLNVTVNGRTFRFPSKSAAAAFKQEMGAR